jgi:hypothetical protein
MSKKPEVRIQDIIQAVSSLNEVYSNDYTLLGGASMILRGFNRTTNDIDILLPPASMQNIASAISTTSGKIINEEGAYYIKLSNTRRIPIDFLSETVGGLDYC